MIVTQVKKQNQVALIQKKSNSYKLTVLENNNQVSFLLKPQLEQLR